LVGRVEEWREMGMCGVSYHRLGLGKGESLFPWHLPVPQVDLVGHQQLHHVADGTEEYEPLGDRAKRRTRWSGEQREIGWGGYLLLQYISISFSHTLRWWKLSLEVTS
jgi:hypothetical protein